MNVISCRYLPYAATVATYSPLPRDLRPMRPHRQMAGLRDLVADYRGPCLDRDSSPPSLQKAYRNSFKTT